MDSTLSSLLSRLSLEALLPTFEEEELSLDELKFLAADGEAAFAAAMGEVGVNAHDAKKLGAALCHSGPEGSAYTNELAAALAIIETSSAPLALGPQTPKVTEFTQINHVSGKPVASRPHAKNPALTAYQRQQVADPTMHKAAAEGADLGFELDKGTINPNAHDEEDAERERRKKPPKPPSLTEQRVQTLATMSGAQLKQLIARAGLGCEGCIEKSDLEARALQALEAPGSHTSPMPGVNSAQELYEETRKALGEPKKKLLPEEEPTFLNRERYEDI